MPCAADTENTEICRKASGSTIKQVDIKDVEKGVETVERPCFPRFSRLHRRYAFCRSITILGIFTRIRRKRDSAPLANGHKIVYNILGLYDNIAHYPLEDLIYG